MAVVESDAEISKAKQLRIYGTLLQNAGNNAEDPYLRSKLDGRINAGRNKSIGIDHRKPNR